MKAFSTQAATLRRIEKFRKAQDALVRQGIELGLDIHENPPFQYISAEEREHIDSRMTMTAMNILRLGDANARLSQAVAQWLTRATPEDEREPAVVPQTPSHLAKQPDSPWSPDMTPEMVKAKKAELRAVRDAKVAAAERGPGEHRLSPKRVLPPKAKKEPEA